METAGSVPAPKGKPWEAIGCITIPFLALAGLVLSWGVRARWSDGALLRNGVTVEGRVRDLRHVQANPSITRGRGMTGVSPVVEFTTSTGERLSAVGSINRYPPEFAVGDVVDVAYDSADPRRADVVPELRRWRFWFVIWSSLAAALAAIAFLPIVLWRRQPDEAATAS